MKAIEHTDAKPSSSPAFSLKGWIAGLLSAVMGGLILYFFVNLRATRLETGVSPSMRNGRPEGSLALNGGPENEKERRSFEKDREQFEKEPVYVVTLTNVSQQTLFRCYPIVSPLGGASRVFSGYDAVDIKSGDRHDWSVSGPNDEKGQEWPVSIHALCTYYDAFGFKHLIDKDVEKDDIEKRDIEDVFRH